MKQIISIILFFSLSLFTTGAQGLFENFESTAAENINSYTENTIELNSGQWLVKGISLMDENDRHNEARSIRLRGNSSDPADHRVEMLFDKMNGAGIISFQHGSYGDNTGGQIQLYTSIDEGNSWQAQGNPITAISWQAAGNQLSSAIYTLNIEGKIRIKIVKINTKTNTTVNIDNISITDYTVITEPEIPTIHTNRNEISFNPAVVNETISQVITIEGEYLTNPITYRLDNNAHAKFSTIESNWSSTEGGDLSIEFISDATGLFNATLIIESTGAESISIPLSAEAIEANSIATLSEIKIDDEVLLDFDPYIYEYTYMLPEEYEGYPIIEVTPTDINATVSPFDQPEELPANIAITITAADEVTTENYTLYIIEHKTPSSNANLSDVKINNISLSGFDPEITEYSLMQTEDFSGIPSIDAIADSNEANISIDSFETIPAIVKIVVTAEDLTEKIYTIYLNSHFTEPLDNWISDGGFESWRSNGNPRNWYGSLSSISISQSKESHRGRYAVELINTESEPLVLSTETNLIKEGYAYEISFYAKGKGEVSTGLYNGIEESTPTYNEYIEINNDNWIQYAQIVRAENNTSAAQFLLSAKNTGKLLIDDVYVYEFLIEEPTIITDKTIIDFDKQYITEVSEEQILTINSKDLSDNISYSIMNDDAGVFVITEGDDWDSSAGGSLKITFTPTENIPYSATLLLKSEAAASISVALSGTGDIRSAISTLESITINEVALSNFDAATTSYQYMLPENFELPFVITPTPTDKNALVSFITPESAPALISIEVVSPNDESRTTYTIRVVDYFEEPEDNIISNGGFEEWNNSVPTGWVGDETNSGVYSKSENSHLGFYSTELIRTQDNPYRFSTKNLSLDEQYAYSFSYHVKGKGEIYTGLYTDSKRIDNESNTISVNSEEWTEYTDIFEPKETTAIAEFYFAFSKTNGLFVDDVVIKQIRYLTPSITTDVNSLDFETVYITDQDTLEIIVTGTDLSEAITYSFEGENANLFEIKEDEGWNSLTGGKLLVVFTPISTDEVNAEIIISQDEVDEPIHIALSGNGEVKSAVATLNTLTVNGEEIIGFDPSVFEYQYIVPLSYTEIPVVSGEANHEKASLEVVQADSFVGIATITVTAHDGTEQSYQVEFIRSNDALLSDLLIDGISIPGFDSEVTGYRYMLPEGYPGNPIVTVVLNDQIYGAQVNNFAQPTSLPQNVEIIVTAADGTTSITYNLLIRPYGPLSSDATLSEIKINGILISGFNPEITEYSYMFPENYSGESEVTAITNEEYAVLEIQQTDNIPDDVKIIVTADDATEKEYHVYLRPYYADSDENYILNGGFERWKNSGEAFYWHGSLSDIIIAETKKSHQGLLAAELINNSSDYKQLSTESLSVTEDYGYEIKFFARGKGEIRIGLFDGREGDGFVYNPTVSIDSEAWKEITQVVKSTNTSDNAQFLFSARNTDGLFIDDVYISSFVEPELSTDKEAINFSDTYINEYSSEQIIEVTSKYLSSNITYSITGANAGDFQVTEDDTWNASSGGKLILKFKPTQTGSCLANLELSTEGASTVIIPLSGNGAVRSAIATLAEIKINGLVLPGFTSGNTDYQYMLPQGTEAPVIIEPTATDPHATIDFINPASIPAIVAITVTSPNGEANKEYSIRIVEHYEEPENHIANGGFEVWNDGKPNGWVGNETAMGNYSQTENSYGGFYAVELTRTSTGAQTRFSSQPVSLLENYRYIITYYTKGVGNLRTGVYVNGTPQNNDNNRSINSQEWKQYTDTITPGVTVTNAAEFYFAFNGTNGLFIDNVVITPDRILYPETSTETTSLDFGMVYVTDSKTLEIDVQAIDLLEAINPVITGSGNAAFSITKKDNWNNLTGGTLSIVFAPTAETSYSANLEIRSEVETITIPLSGSGKMKSSEASLSDLKVNGLTIAGFTPMTLNYTYIVPKSSSQIPAVTATLANSQASMTITQAENINESATIEVTAHDGTTMTYAVQFVYSSDATLADIKIDGVSIDGFNPATEYYRIMLPNGYSGIPSVSITLNDEVNGATANVDPIESIPAIVDIKVTAADNTLKTYSVRIIPYYEEASGNHIANGGFELWTNNTPEKWVGSKTNIAYNQSEDSHLGFYAVSLNNTSTTEQYFSTQASSVTYDYGYIVSFYAKGKGKIRAELFNNAAISSSNPFIEIDSENWQVYQQTVFPSQTSSASEFIFGAKETDGLWIDDVVVNEYRILHPVILIEPSNLAFGEIYKWDTTSPAQTLEVSGIDLSNPITYSIEGASEGVFTIAKEENWSETEGGILSITFTPDEAKEYAATLTVTSADEVEAKTVSLSGTGLIRKSDADLSNLTINGETLEGFDTAIQEYNVLVYKSFVGIPSITATANDNDANIQITEATTIPGTTEIKVTAHDRETVSTYRVNFYRSDISTLANIKIDGFSLSGFDSATDYYRFMLSEPVSSMPVVSATPTIANAQVIINQASSLPAIVEIKVIAEDDMSEQIYSVRLVDYFEEPFGSFVYNGGFEVWEDNTPLHWRGKQTDIAKTDAILTEDSHWGYYALELINQETYPKRIASLTRQVMAGMDFELTFYVKGKGEIRTGIFDERSLDEGFFHNDYITVNSDTWTQYTQTIRVTKSSSNAEFILSARNTDGLIVDDVVIRLVSETSPSIITNNNSYSFQEEYVGDISEGQTLYIAGIGLSEKIEYELTGDNADGFVITPQSDWDSAIGGNLLITFEPKAAALHDVSLVLKSSGEILKTIALAGLGKARHTDPSLKGIFIDGTPIAGFSPTQIEYTYIVPTSHSGIPVISIEKNDALATEEITQASGIPGKVTIKITAHDKVNTRTYTINFIRSSDATLADIKVDGISIAGFDPEVYTYFHSLPMAYVGVPVISATANDAANGAAVTFSQPSKVPAKVIFEVVSADGEYQTTYILNISEYDENADKNLTKNGSFEFWSEIDGGQTLPDGWFGSKSTVGVAGANSSEDAHSGNYSCELINTLSGYKRFTTQPVSLERGIYQISFYAKGKGDLRVEAFDNRDGNNGFSDDNTYISIDSDSWVMHSQLVQIDITTGTGEIAFYVRNTAGLLIDDVLIEWTAPHGLNHIASLDVYAKVADGRLSVYDAPLGAKISLYDTNGVLLAMKEADSTIVEFSLQQQGVVIVQVIAREGTKRIKVINK